MRLWESVSLVATALLLTDVFATTKVPCSPPSPRELVGGATLIAVATATEPSVWHIDHVLYGSAPSPGTLDFGLRKVGGCVHIAVGKTYLIAEQCPVDAGACYLLARRVEESADDLEFLHGRHIENWESVIEGSKRWIEGLTSTASFNAWIRTADTEEIDRRSTTLFLVRYLETMTADLEWLEHVEPEAARQLLSGAVSRGIRKLDGRWCTAPARKDVDGVLTSVTTGHEWQSAMLEAYSNYSGESPR